MQQFKTTRMGFNQSVVEKSLLACGRHCCLCHKFCGTKMELHHIVQKKDDGEDTFDNCLPLCFDCHADVGQYNPNHPKGKRYTDSELKKHRENWYKKVEQSSGSISINSSYVELDKKAFERLTELLKSDTLIYFIRHHGFTSSSFADEIMHQITRFLIECSLPEFEFIDSDLEGLRSELVFLFEKLDNLIAQNTFGAGPGRQAIPVEWKDLQHERYNQALKDFRELIPDILKTYDSIVKLGRRKLYAN